MNKDTEGIKPNDLVNIMNKCEIYTKLGHSSFLGGVKYFLNGKKVSYKKLHKILKNNINEKASFTYTEKTRLLPFYKGDWSYYSMAYTSNEDDIGFKNIKRLEVKRIYIQMVNAGSIPA